MTSETEVVAAWEEPSDWQQPRPTLHVRGEFAYVTEPATQELHVVDLTQDVELAMELGYTSLAVRSMFGTNNGIAGQVLVGFGTDEQKQRFLPPTFRGEMIWCQLFSEPGAGSDLAGLACRAERDGDEWVINGQKIFTSLAGYADYVWLAARTDPDAPKHKGITIFAVPTDTPGFSYTKIPTMVNASTYQTFYDDVRVGRDAVIGEVNRGWDLIVNQLNYERVGLAPPGITEGPYEAVLEWARDTPHPDGGRYLDREWVQTNLAEVRAGIEYLTLLNWKMAALEAAGEAVNPADASSVKVFGTEFALRAMQLLTEIVGPTAILEPDSPAAVLESRLSRAAQGGLILTFGGGTNEVQRDIIGMVALGLPRSR